MKKQTNKNQRRLVVKKLTIRTLGEVTGGTLQASVRHVFDSYIWQ